MEVYSTHSDFKEEAIKKQKDRLTAFIKEVSVALFSKFNQKSHLF